MSAQNNNNPANPLLAEGGPATVPAPQGPISVIQLPGGSVEERRATQGTGHVRLSGRDATLLSQMRIQYRKVFGVFFDVMEFTGNDLYARATLRQCMGSGNGELSAMASQFLAEDGKPRLHRHLGRADLDLDFDDAPAP